MISIWFTIRKDKGWERNQGTVACAVALNYERWHGSNKETSLGPKSVPKGEELETTSRGCPRCGSTLFN